MNSFKICLHNHFIFNGFTVQPGMIFGIDKDGNSIITNGKPVKQGFYVYTNSNSLDGEFAHIHITSESHPAVYTKICKALRQRERKGLDGVLYRTQAQLEMERWDADSTNKFFKDACTSVGKTTRTKSAANPESAAKYNSMKERCTLTQDKNTCKYNSASGCVTII